MVFGQKRKWPATFNLSRLDGTNGFNFISVSPENYLGSSVSGAGDVDGDKIADVIISPLYADGTAGAYIVFGHSGNWLPTLSSSDLDGMNGFSLYAPGKQYDLSVSEAGDINNDTFDDILICGSDPDYGGTCYVVFGRPRKWPATFNLSSLDGTNGFRFPGFASGDYMHLSGNGAGDVNGDKIADIIIGAPYTNDDLVSGYVIFGHNGGWSSAISPSGLNGTNGFNLTDLGKARQYDPSMGRFLAPDPAYQSPSPYTYCNDNPINLVDPSGSVIVGNQEYTEVLLRKFMIPFEKTDIGSGLYQFEFSQGQKNFGEQLWAETPLESLETIPNNHILLDMLQRQDEALIFNGEMFEGVIEGYRHDLLTFFSKENTLMEKFLQNIEAGAPIVEHGTSAALKGAERYSTLFQFKGAEDLWDQMLNSISSGLRGAYYRSPLFGRLYERQLVSRLSAKISPHLSSPEVRQSLQGSNSKIWYNEGKNATEFSGEMMKWGKRGSTLKFPYKQDLRLNGS